MWSLGEPMIKEGTVAANKMLDIVFPSLMRWICEPWTYHIDANFSSLLPKYKQAAGLGVFLNRFSISQNRSHSINGGVVLNICA